MSLDPLLAEGFVIASHAFAAVAALAIGGVQLAGIKGSATHRRLGYLWAGLMLYVAIGSFWIAELRVWDRWSPIHALSALVVVTVPLAVLGARRGRIGAHRRGMLALYVLALAVTGLFTLWPGRAMHAVLFGA